MWLFRKKKKKMHASSSLTNEPPIEVPSISYLDLQSATGNFSQMIEDEQFGELYKGELSDGTKLAVKKLSPKFHKDDSAFTSEVSSILAAEHPNLIKLMGCCKEADDQFLLYEFVEHSRCLFHLLFNPEDGESLSWQTRVKIIRGISRGLVYLHEKAHVIHGDIRASNILIDEDFNPRISGFGLAKLLPDEDSYVNTRHSNTIGYMAPEYALQGKLTEKADVFGFGVLMLEIVSGRSHFDPDLPRETAFLLQWTWNLYEQHRILELVDPRLQNDFPSEEVFRVIHIALLCTQESTKSRPPMSQVSAMLTGDWEIAVFPSRPGSLTELNV